MNVYRYYLWLFFFNSFDFRWMRIFIRCMIFVFVFRVLVVLGCWVFGVRVRIYI